MTTLSEIERQAYLKKIRTWHEQRGMDIEHQILTEPVMRYIETLEDERNDLRKELMNSVPASRYWAVNKDWLEAQAKQGDIANRAAEIIKDLEKKLELAQHERGEAR